MGQQDREVRPPHTGRDKQIPVALIQAVGAVLASAITVAGGLWTNLLTYTGPGAAPQATATVTLPPRTVTVTLPPSTVPAPPGTSRAEQPGGDPLGTPLLGAQAPDGTVVANSNQTYVNSTTVSLNGQKADLAFGAYCSGGCSEAYVVLNLGRRYSTLKARFGAADNSQYTEPVIIEAIVIDGGQQVSIYPKTPFTVGQSKDVTLQVSNVVQLKFVFRGPSGGVQIGVGDPTAFI